MTIESLKTLKISIAGSTDDGKSTLIGRLLIDSGNVPSDQLQAIADESLRLGRPTPEIAWLTDGLSTEQAKLITIDVAYRTIRWKGRRMQLIDTPGHLEYIQNTASGLCQADVLVLLLDISRDFTPQTLRHLQLAHIFDIYRVVIVVNKMDAVDYRDDAFTAFIERFKSFCKPYIPDNATYVPTSALFGHNIVKNLNHTPWYTGPTLMDFLSNVEIPYPLHSHNMDAPTLALAYWISPNQSLAGIKVLSGHVEVGQMLYVRDAPNLPILVEKIYKDGYATHHLYTGHSAVIELKSPIPILSNTILSSSTLQSSKVCMTVSSLLMQPISSDTYRWNTPIGSVNTFSIEATESYQSSVQSAEFPLFTELLITLDSFNPLLVPHVQRGLITDSRGQLIAITGKANVLHHSKYNHTHDSFS